VLLGKSELQRAVATAAAEHTRWVDDWGLNKGELGPLDKLIGELDSALERARQLKKELEEGDD
jgi:hypothetical protein